MRKQLESEELEGVEVFWTPVCEWEHSVRPQ